MEQEEKIACFLLDYRSAPLHRSKPRIFCSTKDYGHGGKLLKYEESPTTKWC